MLRSCGFVERNHHSIQHFELSSLLFVATILTSLLYSPAEARIITGSIDTASSWQFLDRFVFHNYNSQQHAMLDVELSYHKDTRASLLVYFNSKSDASTGAGNTDKNEKSEGQDVAGQNSANASATGDSTEVEEALRAANYSSIEKTWSSMDMREITDLGLWKDVYNSGMSCMWRDRQARRWGNAFDLHENYEYVSRDGKGFLGDADSSWKKRTDLIQTRTKTERIEIKINETDTVTEEVYTNHSVDNNTKTETSSTVSVSRSSDGLTKLVTVTTRTVESEELYPYRLATLTASVASKSPKWFYFVISNCLPSRSTTDEERNTGQSQDPDYEITSLGGVRCSSNTAANPFCQGPLNRITYRIRMMNGDSHISYDRDGEGVAVTVFLILYLGLLGYMYVVVRRLRRNKKVHHPARLLFASILLQTIAYIFDVNYWQTLKGNGSDEEGGSPIFEMNIQGEHTPREVPWWEIPHVLAKFCSILSECTLLLVCILIGKGWTVTRRKISAMGRALSNIPVNQCTSPQHIQQSYFTIYICVYIAVTCWSIWGFDPALVSFEFESPPGVLLRWTRAFAAVWFMYACWTTIRKYPEKRVPYMLYHAIFLVWILSMPILTGIIAPLIAITYRQRVVFFLGCFTIFVAHCVMGLLWWPSRFAGNFPFLSEAGSRKSTNTTMSSTNNSSNGLSSNAGKNRVSMTGVDAHTQEIEPTRAAFELVAQLRYQLLALQDHSEDLYEQIRDLHEENEEALLNGRKAPISERDILDDQHGEPQLEQPQTRPVSSHYDGTGDNNNGPASRISEEITAEKKHDTEGINSIEGRPKDLRSFTDSRDLERPRTPQRRDLQIGPNISTPKRRAAQGPPPTAPPRSLPSGKPPGSSARKLYAQARLRSSASRDPGRRNLPDSPGGL